MFFLFSFGEFYGLWCIQLQYSIHNIHTYTQTDRGTDRQTDIQTYRHTCMHAEYTIIIYIYIQMCVLESVRYILCNEHLPVFMQVSLATDIAGAPKILLPFRHPKAFWMPVSWCIGSWQPRPYCCNSSSLCVAWRMDVGFGGGHYVLLKTWWSQLTTYKTYFVYIYICIDNHISMYIYICIHVADSEDKDIP